MKIAIFAMKNQRMLNRMSGNYVLFLLYLLCINTYQSTELLNSFLFTYYPFWNLINAYMKLPLQPTWYKFTKKAMES